MLPRTQPLTKGECGMCFKEKLFQIIFVDTPIFSLNKYFWNLKYHENRIKWSTTLDFYSFVLDLHTLFVYLCKFEGKTLFFCSFADIHLLEYKN